MIFSTIWDFKIFDQVYVMAQGVPDRAADTAPSPPTARASRSATTATGAAIAVVLFVRAAALLDRSTCASSAKEATS